MDDDVVETEEVETVEIDVEVLEIGDNAMLVTNGDIEEWVPYNLIDAEISDINKFSEEGDEGELVIPLWKAVELGFV